MNHPPTVGMRQILSYLRQQVAVQQLFHLDSHRRLYKRMEVLQMMRVKVRKLVVHG